MDKNTLKSYFQTGKKPTQGQFSELIDSFLHKDEEITISNIKNLNLTLAEKANRADVPGLVDLDGKVNTYIEKTVIIPPFSENGYAKICSVKTGSCVIDFEINEYPGGYYYSYWNKSYMSKKQTDRLMISSGRYCNNVCTLRSTDFIYNLYNFSSNGYTDIYIKTNSSILKRISLRLSFATNKEENAILFYDEPQTYTLSQINDRPIEVDTVKTIVQEVQLDNAMRISISSEDITAGYKEIDMVSYADFIIETDTDLPDGFYFSAQTTDNNYLSENTIFRFSFNHIVNDFTVKAGETTLFSYSETLRPKDVLTGIPASLNGEEWTFSVNRTQLISSDNSVEIEINNGITDLKVNSESIGKTVEITEQNKSEYLEVIDNYLYRLNIPNDTTTLILSCNLHSEVIMSFAPISGSFTNGHILKVLNNQNGSKRFATWDNEGGQNASANCIRGLSGIHIESEAFGFYRSMEFVFWNNGWFSPTYSYSNSSGGSMSVYTSGVLQGIGTSSYPVSLTPATESGNILATVENAQGQLQPVWKSSKKSVELADITICSNLNQTLQYMYNKYATACYIMSPDADVLVSQANMICTQAPSGSFKFEIGIFEITSQYATSAVTVTNLGISNEITPALGFNTVAFSTPITLSANKLYAVAFHSLTDDNNTGNWLARSQNLPNSNDSSSFFFTVANGTVTDLSTLTDISSLQKPTGAAYIPYIKFME